MKYTATQIENAKTNYNSFVSFENANNYEVNIIGLNEAEKRAEFHNNIVTEIKAGNQETIKTWKLFFLNEEVKKDQKNEASKAKLNANKEASSDILAPIKAMKKLGAFGKWLNTSGNQFRKQHFNKIYTLESVNTFLETL